MRSRILIGVAAAGGFIGTVYAANWAITKYGPVSVGFGLLAPAGVYFAGLAFTLRDIVHRTFGRLAVIAAILGGAAASWQVSSTFAVASGVAFLSSELLDLAAYEAGRQLQVGWIGRVIGSNVVGLTADSLIFLYMAFGSLSFLGGQMVGKFWMTLAALPVVLLLRRVLPDHDTDLVPEAA